MSVSSVTIHQFAVWEDSSLCVMARIKGNLGGNLTQAYLSAITCRVYSATGTLVSSPTVTVASAVYDTLQTTDDDPRWEEDDDGYNFLHVIPASAFATPQIYRVEYKFTPNSGDPFYLVCKIHALNLLQS